jgi:hypothetical protein
MLILGGGEKECHWSFALVLQWPTTPIFPTPPTLTKNRSNHLEFLSLSHVPSTPPCRRGHLKCAPALISVSVSSPRLVRGLSPHCCLSLSLSLPPAPLAPSLVTRGRDGHDAYPHPARHASISLRGGGARPPFSVSVHSLSVSLFILSLSLSVRLGAGHSDHGMLSPRAQSRRVERRTSSSHLSPTASSH